MTHKKLETLKTQAAALSVTITVNHYDVNRYSITVGNHVHTSFNQALSAITTKWLKRQGR